MSRILALALALGLASAAPAQSQAPAPASTAQPPPRAAQAEPSPPTQVQSPQLRAALDGAKLELDQVEAALRRPTLSSFDLQELRARIDPVSERLRDVVSEVEPRVEAARARLEQLGPKPKEGAPAEGQEIARDRADREAALSAVGDIQRIARAELLEAEQLTQVISDRRRTAFTQALFERSYSLLSPDLWTSTAASFGRDLRALRFVGSDLWSRIEARSSAGALTFLALAIGVFTALHAMRRHLAPRIVRRDPKRTEVNRHRQVITASAVLAVDAVPAAAGSFLVYQVLVLSDLSPPRLLPVAGAILAGIAFVVFIRAAATALIPAERPAWRIFALSDTAASRTTLFLISFATVLATGKVLDALNQAIAAGLPLSVATRGVMTLAAALILAELLRRFATTAAVEEACLGPYIPPEPEAGGPVRLLGWALVTLIMGALAFGYIAFASFLTDQIAWVGSLAAVLYLGVQLTDEVIGHTLREENRVSTVLQANLGLRRRSLVRFGVLATGIVRVTLVLAVAMLALAPWGVESGDITSNLRAAFFGFKVGDVTISLSTTVFAIGIFILAVATTRVLQRWLDKAFLPTTDLDAGLRNSIVTAIGYLGFFAGTALAFSYLGLGLDKIAIVAGALSVGIGFGLQSIVNNFVSGLILLWERPIRVGDLVVIGDGEGYVRRISVRATEIETFDRSSVIIPNSNLISGVVKNRVRGDKTGRVVLPVQVLRNQDPARAAELLVGAASTHPDVLADPPPRVVFRKIGDTWLDLELYCYVDDVNKQLRVQSDLNFKVFSTLVSSGIMPPLGPGAMNIGGLEQVQAALQGIADSIAKARVAETAGPGPEEAAARPRRSAPKAVPSS